MNQKELIKTVFKDPNTPLNKLLLAEIAYINALQSLENDPAKATLLGNCAQIRILQSYVSQPEYVQNTALESELFKDVLTNWWKYPQLFLPINSRFFRKQTLALDKQMNTIRILRNKAFAVSLLIDHFSTLSKLYRIALAIAPKPQYLAIGNIVVPQDSNACTDWLARNCANQPLGSIEGFDTLNDLNSRFNRFAPNTIWLFATDKGIETLQNAFTPTFNIGTYDAPCRCNESLNVCTAHQQATVHLLLNDLNPYKGYLTTTHHFNIALRGSFQTILYKEQDIYLL